MDFNFSLIVACSSKLLDNALKYIYTKVTTRENSKKKTLGGKIMFRTDSSHEYEEGYNLGYFDGYPDGNAYNGEYPNKRNFECLKKEFSSAQENRDYAIGYHTGYFDGFHEGHEEFEAL